MSEILHWLYATIPVDHRYIFWGLNVALAVSCLALIWLVNYSVRRAMGFYKFRGVWYSRKQFSIILERAYDDWKNKSIMDEEERNLVEKYVLGRSGKLIRSVMRHKLKL